MPKTLFAASLQKTQKLLEEVEGELSLGRNRQKSYSLLRAVLHTLRDRLPISEAVEMGTQLPMIVRGFYYEGWRPSQTPKKMNRQEFLYEIQRQLSFVPEMPMDEMVYTVLAILERYVSPGEMKDIGSVLPKNFKDLLPE